MQSQTTRLIIAIIVTAIIVGSGTYYFLDQNSNSPTSPTTSSVQEDNTFTQSSKEYAVMGREVRSAFECASWAGKIGNAEETERLFLFGYNQGKKFISALFAQKINEEDISKEVPIGVTMLLQGPSEEFILGGIYSFAEDEALKDVYNTGDEYNSDEVQKSIAENKFLESNCKLIGG